MRLKRDSPYVVIFLPLLSWQSVFPHTPMQSLDVGDFSHDNFPHSSIFSFSILLHASRTFRIISFIVVFSRFTLQHASYSKIPESMPSAISWLLFHPPPEWQADQEYFQSQKNSLNRHAPKAVKISHDPFRHYKMAFHAPGQLLSHMCPGLKKAVQISIFHSQNPAVEQAMSM